MSRSGKENYDVLGRELVLEYELRLLPDDECIIFVCGENPIWDKKWFPWEHEQYLEARKRGIFNPKEQKEKQEKLEAAMDRLRGKFGTDVISYGAARPEKEEDPLP